MNVERCRHCPAQIQGGADGMAAHLKVVHPEQLVAGATPATSTTRAPGPIRGRMPRQRRPVAGYVDVAARAARGPDAEARARRGRAVVEAALRKAPVPPDSRTARRREVEPPPSTV